MPSELSILTLSFGTLRERVQCRLPAQQKTTESVVDFLRPLLLRLTSGRQALSPVAEVKSAVCFTDRAQFIPTSHPKGSVG